MSPLTFFPPATEVFSCLELARQAGIAGGTLPAVLNAANEVAVESFLRGEVDFLQIAHIIEEVMSRHKNKVPSQVSEILDADYWARQESLRVLDKKVR